MKKLLTLALLAAIAVGCGPRGGNADGLPVIDVVGNIGTYRQIPMSELIEEVEYIPLETARNCLIDGYKHVIVTDTRVFVGDYAQCYAFSREGKFISDVGRPGRGPGEWIYFLGMSVDEENEIIYLDAYEKILEYTWDGKFVRDFEKPKFQRETGVMFVSNVVFLGDNLFLAHVDNDSGQEPYNWVIFDDTGSIVKTFDNHTRIEKDLFTSSIFHSIWPVMDSGNIYVKELINDTLYSLDRRHELKPAYVFNLGKYTFRTDFHLSVQDVRSNPESVSVGGNIIISHNNLFFSSYVGDKAGFPRPEGITEELTLPVGAFFTPQVSGPLIIDDTDSVRGLYDMNSGKVEFLDRDQSTRRLGFINDLDGGLSFWPKTRTSTGDLLQVVEAFDMKETLTEEYLATHPARDPAAHARLRELLTNLKETDNPVIVIAKLK